MLYRLRQLHNQYDKIGLTCFIISGDDHLDNHFRLCRSACAGRREGDLTAVALA